MCTTNCYLITKVRFKQIDKFNIKITNIIQIKKKFSVSNSQVKFLYELLT